MLKLENLYLDTYSEKYKNLLESFNNESKSDFIYNIADRLISSSNKDKFTFDVGYVVLNESLEGVGYVFISGIRNDNLYIEYSITKENRGYGYGKKLLNEVTNYLFENYNIKDARLDIDSSNQKSIKTAEACGYFLDEDDFERKGYQGKMIFIKDNPYYISKRLK